MYIKYTHRNFLTGLLTYFPLAAFLSTLSILSPSAALKIHLNWLLFYLKF